MGIQLNGNTGIVVLGTLTALVIIGITIISAVGHPIPDALDKGLIALLSATGGAGALHQLNTGARAELKQTIVHEADRVTAAVEESK